MDVKRITSICRRNTNETALSANVDVIITRNGKDFIHSQLPVMTAADYLATMEKK